jgi:hypothetical protein
MLIRALQAELSLPTLLFLNDHRGACRPVTRGAMFLGEERRQQIDAHLYISNYKAGHDKGGRFRWRSWPALDVEYASMRDLPGKGFQQRSHQGPCPGQTFTPGIHHLQQAVLGHSPTTARTTYTYPA